MKNIVDKIYCINLDKRTDRWAQVKEHFDKHELTVERFAAIDGKEFKRESALKTGLIGCNLSHYFLIERAKILGLESILVFEDDAVLHDDFNLLLEQCINDLPADWDMLYFGGSHKEKPTVITNNIYRVNKTLTTHAYIMRSTMFDRALQMLRIIEVNNPVDGIFADLQKEFNVYITNPPLAWQRPGHSDIEGRVMSYEWIKTNEQ